MTLSRGVLLVPLTLLLTSCCLEIVDGHSTSGGTGTSGNGCSGEVPASHRPASVACSGDAGGCQQDADCPLDGGLRTCSCAYYDYYPNECIPSGCRVDGDCACGYCSPSFVSCVYAGGLDGYYCHTPADACINDRDCDAGLGCQYNPLLDHWACARAPRCNG